MGLLDRAYSAWSKRRYTSREALHATNVLTALLKKVSLIRTEASERPQPQATSAAAIEPPAPSDVRSRGMEYGYGTASINSNGSEAAEPQTQARVPRAAVSEPAVVLPSCNGQLHDGANPNSGFTMADAFDFSNWNLVESEGDLYPEFMDVDKDVAVVPLDNFLGDMDNIDWVSRSGCLHCRRHDVLLTAR